MPPTIQAVVCTVDFSPFSPLVVHCGTTLARRAGAHLYLVHAVNEPQDGAHPTAMFERGGGLAHLTHEARRRMQTLIDPPALAWEAVVRFGDPVEETVDFVSHLPSCLVISASHGVSGFRRLLVGTVVERLTRALSHPMLVVKPSRELTAARFDGFRSVVVGCDRRGGWQRLAALMPLLGSKSAVGIHLVHAMEVPSGDNPTASDALSYHQVQQSHQERLSQRLCGQAQQLFPLDLPLSVSVAPGDPEVMVREAAGKWAADLIVVGVRRSGKMGRWIAGSTTEALLRRAPCSVLTIPETPPPPESKGVRP
jgi:nucleotide-binding universal stress UspA family protein